MNNINNKKGQVILIALLVMAVILVVALAIGTLMVRELRMAGNIDRSVTAYFAAESGLEEELWKVRKNPPMDTIPYGEDLTIEGARWDLTKSEAPEEEFTNKDLERDKSEQIYFPYSDLSMVKSVKFTQWTPEPPATISWLEYRVISWPKAIKFDPSKIETKEGLLDDPDFGGGVCINLDQDLPTITNYDHIFRFKPLHGGATYSLIGYSDIGCTPGNEENIGGGKLELPSTGTYQATKRGLSIVFYPKPPLHGIFDYVLFSDESIVK